MEEKARFNVKYMEEMKLYTHEEMLDRVIGTKGTPAREKYETDINNFLLGELMGVKRAQISKIESGKSISFSTIVRAFKAMGVKTASLELGSLGKVALW